MNFVKLKTHENIHFHIKCPFISRSIDIHIKKKPTEDLFIWLPTFSSCKILVMLKSQVNDHSVKKDSSWWCPIMQIGHLSNGTFKSYPFIQHIFPEHLVCAKHCSVNKTKTPVQLDHSNIHLIENYIDRVTTN